MSLNKPWIVFTWIVFFSKPYCQYPRLCEKLSKVKDAMDLSYGKLAKFVTEFKMDHDNGNKESDRLNKSLGYTLQRLNSSSLGYIYIFQNVYGIWIELCKTFFAVIKTVFQNDFKHLAQTIQSCMDSTGSTMVSNDEICDDSTDWLQELLDYNRKAGFTVLSFFPIPCHKAFNFANWTRPKKLFDMQTSAVKYTWYTQYFPNVHVFPHHSNIWPWEAVIPTSRVPILYQGWLFEMIASKKLYIYIYCFWENALVKKGKYIYKQFFATWSKYTFPMKAPSFAQGHPCSSWSCTRKRQPTWQEALDDKTLAMPRTQNCFSKIEKDDRLDYCLPPKHALPGSVLKHCFATVDKTIAKNKPVIFKIGYTHDAYVRFYNRKFGYVLAQVNWEHMLVLYAASGTISPGFVEAALIHHYKGFLHAWILYDHFKSICCIYIYI